jgi:hypothetical protein
MVCAPQTLIFFHIGKTGGVSLGTVLARNFPLAQQFNGNVGETRSALGVRRLEPIADAYHALEPDHRRQIRLVAGHVPMGLHTMLEQPARYVTLLRHPVERVISSFSYMRQVPAIPIQPWIRAMSLEAYIDSRLGLDPYDYQVRVLSGAAELDAAWEPPGPLKTAAVERRHLRQAQHNIRTHFVFAGTLERFEEALILLRWMYGWRFEALLVERQHITPGRPRLTALPAATLEKIRAHNALDLALYKWVDARFRQLTRALGLRFRLEAQTLRWLSRRFEQQGMTAGLRRSLAEADELFGER